MESKHKVWSYIESKLTEKSVFNADTGCLVWRGAKSSRKSLVYGKLRVRLPTHHASKSHYVHRLAYMCKTQTEIYHENRVSHLCNNSLCIAPGHVHLETLSVNVRRRTCFQFGVCLGHDSEPHCVSMYLLNNCTFIYVKQFNVHTNKQINR